MYPVPVMCMYLLCLKLYEPPCLASPCLGMMMSWLTSHLACPQVQPPAAAEPAASPAASAASDSLSTLAKRYHQMVHLESMASKRAEIIDDSLQIWRAMQGGPAPQESSCAGLSDDGKSAAATATNDAATLALHASPAPHADQSRDGPDMRAADKRSRAAFAAVVVDQELSVTASAPVSPAGGADLIMSRFLKDELDLHRASGAADVLAATAAATAGGLQLQGPKTKKMRLSYKRPATRPGLASSPALPAVPPVTPATLTGKPAPGAPRPPCAVTPMMLQGEAVSRSGSISTSLVVAHATSPDSCPTPTDDVPPPPDRHTVERTRKAKRGDIKSCRSLEDCMSWDMDFLDAYVLEQTELTGDDEEETFSLSLCQCSSSAVSSAARAALL